VPDRAGAGMRRARPGYGARTAPPFPEPADRGPVDPGHSDLPAEEDLDPADVVRRTEVDPAQEENRAQVPDDPAATDAHDG